MKKSSKPSNKSKLSLADELSKTAPTGIAWYKCLSKSDMEELEDLRIRFQAGEFPHHKTQILRIVNSRLGLGLKEAAFTRWLRAKPRVNKKKG